MAKNVYHTDGAEPDTSQVLLLQAPDPDVEKSMENKNKVAFTTSKIAIAPIAYTKAFVEICPRLRTSTITAKLGFPLKAALCPLTIHDTLCWAANVLFIDSDPDSPTFCDDDIPNLFRSDALGVRTDGKIMSAQQFQTLYQYVVGIGQAWLLNVRDMEEGKEKSVAKGKIEAKLSPEAFHAFFEDFRRQKVRAGVVAFEKTVSPVNITLGEVEPTCGACYGKAGSERRLFACAKCKTTYYCGRECQKAEWKEHKKVCGMK